MCTCTATSCKRASPGQPLEQLARIVHRHAELVDLEAGGNVRVAQGVDVGIHPHRHTRDATEALRDRFDPRELAGRLDVDRFDAQIDGAFELGGRFADAGEHDLRRREPRFERQLDLPDRVGVGRAAQATQQPHERQRRIRLERVVQRVRIAAERLVDGAIPFAQQRGAVDVDGRRGLGGDLGERDAVAHEVVGLSGETCRAGRWLQRGTLLYPIHDAPGVLSGVK